MTTANSKTIPSDLSTLTLSRAIALLKSKKISLAELYTSLEKKAVLENQKYNIFISLANKLVPESQKIELPLAGVPISLKDNIATKNLKTTASSTLLSSFLPQYDATVTTKLKNAGAVIQGKTNLDAWAHGSSTETSQFGTTLNPRNPKHSPGGSSGGSAAAVASNACIASLGTETAGSIRLPSAWCGVVGLKPTYGRVSRQGIVAMASSTDSPGPITKTVEDSAILLNHIAGFDPYDGTTSSNPVPDYTKSLSQGIKGLKIGAMYFDYPELAPVMKHYHSALKTLETAGATVEPVSAMDPRYAISVYTIVQRGEVSSNLGRFDGVRYGQGRDTFGDEAKRRIMLGTFTLSKGYSDQYYTLAQKVRSLFIQDFKNLFTKYDVLVGPTNPTFALKVGASQESNMFGELMDVLMEASSIVGLPGLTVPCYQDSTSNLFLGLNIMAPMWREDLCLKTGAAYEAATDWNSWIK
jgi:aspartyl-tRNA(Asn)/glutamyl-tRNA(Gln) amidotransferase subunit A